MAFTKEALDEILKDYRGPGDFYGPEGIMKQLTKALVERTMEAELTEHPCSGPVAVEIPRYREGSFEPHIVPKHRREFCGFDDKILSMYALGLTTRQIPEHLKETYTPQMSRRN